MKFYKEVGTVKEYGNDWVVFDIKELENVYSKIKGISDVKRLIVSKHISRTGSVFTKVQYFTNYKFSSSVELANSRTIVKKNKVEGSVVLKEMPLKPYQVKRRNMSLNFSRNNLGLNGRVFQTCLLYTSRCV